MTRRTLCRKSFRGPEVSGLDWKPVSGVWMRYGVPAPRYYRLTESPPFPDACPETIQNQVSLQNSPHHRPVRMGADSDLPMGITSQAVSSSTLLMSKTTVLVVLAAGKRDDSRTRTDNIYRVADLRSVARRASSPRYRDRVVATRLSAR